jgi:hypothetical protein
MGNFTRLAVAKRRLATTQSANGRRTIPFTSLTIISRCEPMWRKMIGAGKNEVTQIKQHMKQQFAVSAHGNIGNKSRLQGKITVDAGLAREIRELYESKWRTVARKICCDGWDSSEDLSTYGGDV